jgi:hypothetical protein
MNVKRKVNEGQKAKWQSRPGSVSVAAGRRGRLNLAFFARSEHFRGKSIEVPIHEPFTRRNEFSRQSPIKPNQA